MVKSITLCSPYISYGWVKRGEFVMIHFYCRLKESGNELWCFLQNRSTIFKPDSLVQKHLEGKRKVHLLRQLPPSPHPSPLHTFIICQFPPLSINISMRSSQVWELRSFERVHRELEGMWLVKVFGTRVCDWLKCHNSAIIQVLSHFVSFIKTAIFYIDRKKWSKEKQEKKNNCELSYSTLYRVKGYKWFNIALCNL